MSVQETVDLVEDIAVQFITDTVHAAMTSAAARNPGTYGSSSSSSAAAKKDEIRLEDLLFAVRRDPRKVARIQVRTERCSRGLFGMFHRTMVCVYCIHLPRLGGLLNALSTFQC